MLVIILIEFQGDFVDFAVPSWGVFTEGYAGLMIGVCVCVVEVNILVRFLSVVGLCASFKIY